MLINFVLPTFVCCMEIHAHILCLMAATDSRNAKLQMISRQREVNEGEGGAQVCMPGSSNNNNKQGGNGNNCRP